MNVLQEYRNQNEHRKYPFTDSSLLSNAAGQRIPTDFIVDAVLYPIDAIGPLYISAIDFGQRTITFYDGGARQIFATAQWDGTGTEDYETVVVYDATISAVREVGTLLIKPTALATAELMEFAATDLALLPTCAIALWQDGVRGCISSDDGQLTTGDIKLVGRNGVSIHTYVDGEGRSVVRVDVYGTAAPPEEDCDNRPPITSVLVNNDYCTPIVATPGTASIINIAGAAPFDLDNQCPKPRLPDAGGTLPSQEDVCDDVPPTPSFVCPDPTVFIIAITTGELFLVAPDTIAEANIVYIRTDDTPGIPVALRESEGDTLDDVADRMSYALRNAGTNRGRVTIMLRGPIR